ncbi:MAG: restriction endonuclease subunit S [Pseudomonadota bacterium]
MNRYKMGLVERIRSSVGTTMTNLNQGTLANLKIVVPPSRAEQEAIAEALSDADALIESLEQLVAKKRQIKQGAMQELLTGKRRLPGFSDHWEMADFGSVIERFVGGGTPSRAIPSYWGDEIPWVTVKDFATFNPRQSQEGITRIGLNNSASHLIPKGTLITSTRMALGKAVIYDVDVAINQDLKAIFPRAILSTNYLYHWFNFHGHVIDDLGSGSTVKGVSIADLRKVKFQLPSYREQLEITAICDEMDAEISVLESKLAKARAIKQGMMQELLTGRIRLV